MIPARLRVVVPILFLLLFPPFGAVMSQPLLSNFTGASSELAQAIDDGDAEVVARLLDGGADPDARGRGGATPTMLAASRTDGAAVLRLLLEAGADPNLTDDRGHSATSLALLATPAPWQERFDPEATYPLSVVLEAGGDPDTIFPNGDPAVFWALNQVDGDMIRLLIEHGADPNIKGRTERPIVVNAALTGYWNPVRALVESGADWRRVDRGLSVPGLLTDADVVMNKDSAAYRDLLAVRKFVTDAGMTLPAPGPREVNLREGRMMNDGTVVPLEAKE